MRADTVADAEVSNGNVAQLRVEVRRGRLQALIARLQQWELELLARASTVELELNDELGRAVAQVELNLDVAPLAGVLQPQVGGAELVRVDAGGLLVALQHLQRLDARSIPVVAEVETGVGVGGGEVAVRGEPRGAVRVDRPRAAGEAVQGAGGPADVQHQRQRMLGKVGLQAEGRVLDAVPQEAAVHSQVAPPHRRLVRPTVAGGHLRVVVAQVVVPVLRRQ